jgi:type I restriction enzyme S subunit
MTVTAHRWKHSGLGQVPEDWQVDTISGLGGKITSGSRGWAEFYSDYGDLFVRITNLRRSNIHLDLSSTRYVTLPDSNTEANRTRLKNGDLLISITADIGIVGYVDQKVPSPSYINQHIARVRFAPGKVSSKFIAYYLSSWAPQKMFIGSTDTGAKAGMNLATVGGLKTVVPPLNEQLRIAEALGDADELIALLERLIAKKKSIKHGIMQQLLTGKTRLPGFTEPWKNVTLIELANGKRDYFNDGDWIESPHITTAGNRLLQTGNIGVGQLIAGGKRRYVSDDSFTRLRCKEVVPGDILICRLAEPAGRACLVPDIGERRMLTAVDVTIFRPDEAKVDRRYIVAALSTPAWLEEVSDRSGGSTRTRIPRSELGRISISLPSRTEQSQIADVISDADSEIAALDARLTLAKAIKQGMM